MGLVMIRKILPLILLAFALYSFTYKSSLKGTYEYAGGIYNGKAESASKDYTLRRSYDAAHYQGLFIAAGEDTVTYEKGDYRLQKDTCLETQTFSSQPSKVTGLTLRYRYQVKNDTLIFSGILPNGTSVKEFWKKVK